MKFSLAKKLILYISLFLFFVMVPFAGYFYFEYREMTEGQVRSHLISFAEAIEGQVFLFFDKNKIQISDWSSDGHISEEFEEILETNDQKKIRSLSAYIKTNKHSVSSNVKITDIFNLEGVAVVSTDEQRAGHIESEEELEEEYSFLTARVAKHGEAFVTKPAKEEDEPGHSPGKVMWHISTPLVSPRTGMVIGVMVNHILGNELAEILAGRWHVEHGAQSGQGFSANFKTSEMYLVDNDRLMITPSRFIEEAVLRVRVDTRPVAACFDEGIEIDGSYEGYRGSKVYGASMCMADKKTVLIVEIAEEEIFAELKKEEKDFIILAGLFLVAGILGSILFSRFFIKNIKILQLVANKVREGDFDIQAEIHTSDEIGDLSAVFNSMLATIRDNRKQMEISKHEIEIKAHILEEDLNEHKKQQEFLEQSKKATLSLLEDSWKTGEKLQAESNRLQTIISSIGDGLILIDGEYKVVLVNPRAFKMFEMPIKEIMGKDLREVMKLWRKKKDEILPAQWPIEEMFLTRSVVTTRLEDEISLTTVHRENQVPIVLSAAPLSGGLSGGVIVIRDVTADRELDDAKSGFISVASHQLRTPLTSIRWYSEMLLSNDVGPLNEAQKDFMIEVHDGAERLYRTVDLLLGISRIESGKIKAEKVSVDLGAFTGEIVKELSSQIDEKKIVLSMLPPEGGPVVVVLDSLTLRQVILNLLSNAIRYTNEDNGIIEVRWNLDEAGKEVRYSVSDNGIGIPDAQRGRIFSKFFRAENALAHVPDGSGLGLALVKELVESWGGKVWFKTEERKGSTFYFTIPLVPAPEVRP